MRKAKIFELHLVAIALAQQGNAAQAATLFGAVDRERDNCGLVVPPPDIPIRETTTSHARAALGDDWDTYVEQGYSMRYRQAVERAAGEIGGSLQEIVPV